MFPSINWSRQKGPSRSLYLYFSPYRFNTWATFHQFDNRCPSQSQITYTLSISLVWSFPSSYPSNCLPINLPPPPKKKKKKKLINKKKTSHSHSPLFNLPHIAHRVMAALSCPGYVCNTVTPQVTTQGRGCGVMILYVWNKVTPQVTTGKGQWCNVLGICHTVIFHGTTGKGLWCHDPGMFATNTVTPPSHHRERAVVWCSGYVCNRITPNHRERSGMSWSGYVCNAVTPPPPQVTTRNGPLCNVLGYVCNTVTPQVTTGKGLWCHVFCTFATQSHHMSPQGMGCGVVWSVCAHTMCFSGKNFIGADFYGNVSLYSSQINLKDSPGTTIRQSKITVDI